MEKRRTERSRKRIMVRYGLETPEKAAFTRNLSSAGLFLQTNAVFKPGSTLQLKFDFQERSIEIWGRVAWAKRVPPQLAHILECGMGISFIDPPEEWLELHGTRH
jgi:Tfp pilus assembly protein PilZ